MDARQFVCARWGKDDARSLVMSGMDGRPGRGPIGLLLRADFRLLGRALGRLLSLRQELLCSFVRRVVLERVVQHSAGLLRSL